MPTFQYTPATGLNDTAAYPTTPVSEAAARQQFMDLFNQVRDYMNNSLAIKNQPPAWTAVTLLNSWVNFGGAYSPAGYCKDDFSNVLLRGLIKSGVTTNSTPLFTLPVGYRPSTQIILPNMSFTGTVWQVCNIEIKTDGTVMAGGNAANTWFTLDGISFRAEQ